MSHYGDYLLGRRNDSALDAHQYCRLRGHCPLSNAGTGQGVDGHDDSKPKTLFCEALVALSDNALALSCRRIPALCSMSPDHLLQMSRTTAQMV